MTDMEDRWLSVDEITRAHRMGRFWKFKKDEVDAWVKAGGADEGKKRDA